MYRKKGLMRTLIVVLVVLFAFSAVAATGIGNYENNNLPMTGITANVLGGEFTEERITGDALAEQIVLEGAVLLRNEMNEEGTARTLPLSWETQRNVAVLGWSATSWVPGGNGSGMVARRSSGHHTLQPTGVGGLGIGFDGGDSMYAEVGLVNVLQARGDGLIRGTNTLGALEMAGITPYQPLLDFYMGYGARAHHRRTLAPGRRPNIAVGEGGAFSGALKAYDFQFYTLIEPVIDHPAYGDEYLALLESAAANNDTAIVVIGRHAGESIDAPKVQYKGIPTAGVNPFGAGQDSFHITDPTRHYLEISTEEEALLTFAGANFDNVIVLINSTNTMELGFLDTIPGIDAALFVGATGIRSAAAIPRLLWDRSERRTINYALQLPANATITGSTTRVAYDDSLTEAQGRYLWPVVSPSGRTAAVFAYDMRTNASWNNAGDSDQDPSAVGFARAVGIPDGHAPLDLGQRLFSNVELGMGLYPLGGGTGGGTGQGVNTWNSNFDNGSNARTPAGAGGYRNAHYQGLAYIDYSEGIFVGYKWYETANEMGVWDEFAYGNIPDWFRDKIGTPNDSADTNTDRNALRAAHNEALVERSIAKIPYERVCFRTGERINPTGFDAVVQFPMGFGLSYTEFEWTVVGVYTNEPTAANSQNPRNNVSIDPYDRVYVDVLVENVGAFAGKEVVQLYVNPPWHEGGLEKSSANLSAFGKTHQVLQPGEAEIVRMWFDVYDMASFDTYNITGVADHGPLSTHDVHSMGGFVLEAGEYLLTVSRNSNYAGRVNGTTGLTGVITLEVSGDHLFGKDPLNTRENDYDSTGGVMSVVMSRFSGEAALDIEMGGDGVPIDDSEYVGGEWVSRMAHLTRNDFTGTFPVLEDAREITEAMMDINLFRARHANSWRDNFEAREGFEAPAHTATATPFVSSHGAFVAGAAANSHLTSGGTTGHIWRGSRFGTTIASLPTPGSTAAWMEMEPQDRTRMGPLAWDMVYNDGNWDAAFHEYWMGISGMVPAGTRGGHHGAGTGTASTLFGSNSFLANHGGWALGERPLHMIGRPRTPALDASNQMNSFRGTENYGGSRGIGWPNSTTVAQTFSYRLARQQGWEKGMEARARGVFGMLSPGVHVHRSPLNGRNFEYYSESAYLAGIMAANYIHGLMDFGIYTYIKHFAVYAQESNRNGLYIFLTEQALREVYLVPFRMGIMRYASTGHGSVAMMSGYSRLGAMYEGGSYHLLTTVLRREWGFRGSVMTDWADNMTYMSTDHALRAGGDKGMNSNPGTSDKGGAGHAETNPGGRFNSPETGTAESGDGTAQAASIEMTSNAILHRAREAVRNLNYAWLFAEFIGANFNPVEARIIDLPTLSDDAELYLAMAQERIVINDLISVLYQEQDLDQLATDITAIDTRISTWNANPATMNLTEINTTELNTQRARLPAVQHTITWNLEGGEWASGFTPATSIETGQSLATPTAPTKAGYDFVGWYTAATGGTRITLPATVTADMVLYARWTPDGVQHQINWQLNGGTWVTDPPTTVADGGTIALPTAPTRAGYTFAGWFTAATGGEAVVLPMENVTANQTIHAQWIPDGHHAITWVLNGGTWVTPPPTSVEDGGTIALPTAPTRAGYTFAGWFTAATGGEAVVLPMENVDGDVTIHAQWTPVTTTPGGCAGCNGADSGSMVMILGFGLGGAALLPAAFKRKKKDNKKDDEE